MNFIIGKNSAVAVDVLIPPLSLLVQAYELFGDRINLVYELRCWEGEVTPPSFKSIWGTVLWFGLQKKQMRGLPM